MNFLISSSLTVPVYFLFLLFGAHILQMLCLLGGLILLCMIQSHLWWVFSAPLFTLSHINEATISRPLGGRWWRCEHEVLFGLRICMSTGMHQYIPTCIHKQDFINLQSISLFLKFLYKCPVVRLFLKSLYNWRWLQTTCSTPFPLKCWSPCASTIRFTIWELEINIWVFQERLHGKT